MSEEQPNFSGQWAIDTHAHIYPGWYLDALEGIGVDPQSTAIARIHNADSTQSDLSDRLHWMDRAGVERQIIAVTPQQPSGKDPQASADLADRINDHFFEIASKHPDRFSVYGALPLPHVKESVQVAHDLLTGTPAVGVSVTTVMPDGTSIADERFDPVWAELDRNHAIVNIHPTGNSAFSPLLKDWKLDWVNGAIVEDATAGIHLLKADIPARFPNIRFHLAHLGGDLPFIAQRLEDNYADWGAFKHSPAETLRSMFFDGANFHTPSLVCAANTLGNTQILGGSDHPYFQHDKYERAFDYIRDAPLPKATRTAILSTNARELFGLQ